MAFAPLSPELKEKALSIASSFASGGMVAKFQFGGEVSEDDLAAAVTEADDLNEALDNLSERDSGDDDDYEETVAAALAGGKDLNEALDFADDVFGDGGDAAPAAPRDDGREAPIATRTAAEALAEKIGVTARPEIAEALIAQQALAARPAVPGSQPEEKEKTSVTEKALTTSPIDFVLTEGYDMAGPAPAVPDIYDDDVDQGSADIGSLAKELGVDLKDVDLSQPGIGGLLAPLGVARAIKDEFTGVGALRDAAAGGEVVRNEKGEVVGVVSRNEAGQVTEISPTGIAAAFDPALRGAYREMAEYDQRELEGRGESDEPITEEDVAMILDEAAAEEPRASKFQFIRFKPEDFNYFTPESFAYNQGISSMYTPRNS